MLKQPLQGRQGGDRRCRRVSVIDGCRLAGDFGRSGQAKFRLRPIAEPVVHAVDQLANAKVRDAVPQA